MFETSARRRARDVGVSRAPLAQSTSRSVIALSLLAAGAALSQTDRNALAVLLVPIQKEIGVGDTAMGALAGLSFTLVYALVGLPMARLADTGIRRNIVAGAIAFWSVMTALSGLASNYVTLLLARMGVAAGEASVQPAQMSLIGDFFSSQRRGAALGVIMFGSAIGTSLGAFMAGWLSDRYNWHIALMALAAPGLVLAAAFVLVVREPMCGAHDGGDDHDEVTRSWRRSLAHLVRIESVPRLLLAAIFVNLSFSIFLSWMPAYLMRVYHMTTTQMSLWFGLAAAPAIIAVLIGGYVSDWVAKKGVRWRVYFMIALLCVVAPLSCVILLYPDVRVVVGLMFVYAFAMSPVASNLPTSALDISRPRLRGTMIAALNFCGMVIGGGVGPLLLGALNDAAKHVLGDQALRYTLLTIPLCICTAALCLLWLSRSIDADARAARN